MGRRALAIFVKTPQISSLKTRLAANIGEERALEFYQLALDATAAMAEEAKRQMRDVDVFWAVAEDQAMSLPQWSQFPTISQGAGGLGERLNHVYQSLLQKYESVSFMGADSPHLKPNELIAALEMTQKNREMGFVLGPTDDGGFYFFGGGQALSSQIWTSVRYSQNMTAQELSVGLAARGTVHFLNQNFDIDVVDDLKKLLAYQPNENLAQRALADWVAGLEMLK
ncbi:MAG: DUF2064 domain-containing protein [Bdellovibrionales bacterium]|jgi:rSAM/selenodomain-associated transferase 1|nr:DUF2064 domain-containing protein [Bdellovibrionales bacterium]